MANKNVDLFQATRELSTVVTDFFFNVIKRDELRIVYTGRLSLRDKLIAENQEKIVQLEKGTLISSLTKDDYEGKIYELLAEKEEISAEWEEQRNKQLTFTYPESAKTLRKAINAATCQKDLVDAITAFFALYNLDVADTTFLNRCLDAVGMKISTKKLTNTAGKECLVYNGNAGTQAIIGVAFESMVQAGTIKPAQIPTALQDKYAKKSKKANK